MASRAELGYHQQCPMHSPEAREGSALLRGGGRHTGALARPATSENRTRQRIGNRYRDFHGGGRGTPRTSTHPKVLQQGAQRSSKSASSHAGPSHSTQAQQPSTAAEPATVSQHSSHAHPPTRVWAGYIGDMAWSCQLAQGVNPCLVSPLRCNLVGVGDVAGVGRVVYHVGWKGHVESGGNGVSDKQQVRGWGTGGRKHKGFGRWLVQTYQGYAG
jgi:hypothetical protein